MTSARPACEGRDPDLFFPTQPAGYAVAKAFCRACPLRLECLRLGLEAEGSKVAGGRHGVYGGLDETERARLMRRNANKIEAAIRHERAHDELEAYMTKAPTPEE